MGRGLQGSGLVFVWVKIAVRDRPVLSVHVTGTAVPQQVEGKGDGETKRGDVLNTLRTRRFGFERNTKRTW